jgi:hypothetical protein
VTYGSHVRDPLGPSSRPNDGVGDDLTDGRVEKYGKRVVAGSKVDDAPLSDGPGQPAAKSLIRTPRGDQDDRLGSGHRERLGVHRGLRNRERNDTARNGMLGSLDFDVLRFAVISPASRFARGSHERLEGLTGTGGVERHESQMTGFDAVGDGLGAGVGKIIVTQSSPPNEHVCRVKGFVRDSAIGVGEPRQRHIQPGPTSQVFPESTVNVRGINRSRRSAFTPHTDAKGRAWAGLEARRSGIGGGLGQIRPGDAVDSQKTDSDRGSAEELTAIQASRQGATWLS